MPDCRSWTFDFVNRYCVRLTIALLLLTAWSAPAAAQGGPYERQRVDDAAATRGRAVYVEHCVNCHGSAAKGTERGPDLIRSPVVLRDRLGSGIGPAARKAPSHQATLSNAQVVDLSHFLHQRIESVASNRNARAPINVLTGSVEAGRAYFNGAGTCSTCHSPAGDLAGIATRISDPVSLQQRFLFPSLRRGGPRQVEATVTVAGRTTSGVLLRQDDFTLALRDAGGEYVAFTRGPGVTVVVRDPLQVHYDLLDRYTDADMHNLTTYLATLK
jgi:mono/diheme cytochrome c family protein